MHARARETGEGADRLDRISVRSLLRLLGDRNKPSATSTGKGRNCAVLLAHLQARQGQICLVDELIEAIWGGEPEGGPLEAEGEIRCMVHGLRREGAAIRTIWGRGYAIILDDAEWACAPGTAFTIPPAPIGDHLAPHHFVA